MRIPSYHRQIGYQRSAAQPVALAPATLETSGSRKWDKWLAASEISKAAGPVFNGAVKWWNKYVEWFHRGEIWLDKPKQYRPYPKSSNNIPQEESEFSSTKRENLLNFARQQINQLADHFTKDSAHSLTGELDAYVIKQLSDTLSPIDLANPDQNLWAQDYVVLRRELEHQQQTKNNYIQEERFNRGAGNFVQMSALIRSPLALQEYINANLSAAQREYVKEKSTSARWPSIKKNLKTSAVEHNIKAAFQTGEIEQAQHMYDYFKSQLPIEKQTNIESKLMFYRSEQVTDRIAQQAYLQCVEKDDEIVPEKLDGLAEDVAHKEGLVKDVLKHSLEMRLQAEIQHRCDQKATLCRYLLDNLSNEDKGTFMNEIEVSSPIEKQLLDWYQESQSKRSTVSDPMVFNVLYQQINNGKMKESDIVTAYHKNTISGADALGLMEHLYSSKSKPVDGREKILAATVVNLCRQHNLNEPETAKAQYLVFSAGPDWKDRFSAARELKDILTLQESKK